MFELLHILVLIGIGIYKCVEFLFNAFQLLEGAVFSGSCFRWLFSPSYRKFCSEGKSLILSVK
jgi:hypothetical protein